MVDRLKKLFFDNWQLFLVIVISAILLLWNVSVRTFWMDETMVLNYFKYSIWDFLKVYWVSPDNHPPLYYLLVLLVSKILPWSELSVRLISVLSGVGITSLVYFFTLALTKNKIKSYGAVFFTAFSSFFVLISQMARYHSLAALFSLLTFYLFLRLYLGVFNKKVFIFYIISLLLTAYTDYPHFIYTIIIINALYFYLLFKKRAPVKFMYWFIGHFIAAILCLPLAYMIYERVVVQGDGGWSNLNLLSNSWLNIFGGIFFHFYVFFFGENIFPWNLAVVIPGLVVLAGVVIGLFIGIRKKLFSEGQIFIILATLLFIIFNTLFMNKADPRYNFTIYPKFGFGAYPLLVISFVLCLDIFKSKVTKASLFLIWIFISAVGLAQFYSLNNYLNGSYFRDFKSYDFVKENSSSGQFLAITPDASEGLYLFYKDKYFDNLKPIDYNIFYSGQITSGSEVWLFTTASDGPESSVETSELIPRGYTILEQFDSVPLNQRFKYYKEKFLHRPSYTFKYSVFLLKKI